MSIYVLHMYFFFFLFLFFGVCWFSRFLMALVAGVPVTVFYRYERSKLALAWREWMTKRVMEVKTNKINAMYDTPTKYQIRNAGIFAAGVCRQHALPYR